MLIAFIYVIPIGMIQAITNQQIGMNVVTELIIGYVLPGRPVAMMLFKTWGYISMSQALQFSSDFKLGHYMKIPPRTLFVAQTAAAALAGTVQLSVCRLQYLIRIFITDVNIPYRFRHGCLRTYQICVL